MSGDVQTHEKPGLALRGRIARSLRRLDHKLGRLFPGLNDGTEREDGHYVTLALALLVLLLAPLAAECVITLADIIVPRQISGDPVLSVVSPLGGFLVLGAGAGYTLWRTIVAASGADGAGGKRASGTRTDASGTFWPALALLLAAPLALECLIRFFGMLTMDGGVKRLLLIAGVAALGLATVAAAVLTARNIFTEIGPVDDPEAETRTPRLLIVPLSTPDSPEGQCLKKWASARGGGHLKDAMPWLDEAKQSAPVMATTLQNKDTCLAALKDFLRNKHVKTLWSEKPANTKDIVGDRNWLQPLRVIAHALILAHEDVEDGDFTLTVSVVPSTTDGRGGDGSSIRANGFRNLVEAWFKPWIDAHENKQRGVRLELICPAHNDLRKEDEIDFNDPTACSQRLRRMIGAAEKASPPMAEDRIAVDVTGGMRGFALGAGFLSVGEKPKLRLFYVAPEPAGQDEENAWRLVRVYNYVVFDRDLNAVTGVPLNPR